MVVRAKKLRRPIKIRRPKKVPKPVKRYVKSQISRAVETKEEQFSINHSIYNNTGVQPPTAYIPGNFYALHTYLGNAQSDNDFGREGHSCHYNYTSFMGEIENLNQTSMVTVRVMLVCFKQGFPQPVVNVGVTDILGGAPYADQALNSDIFFNNKVYLDYWEAAQAITGTLSTKYKVLLDRKYHLSTYNAGNGNFSRKIFLQYRPKQKTKFRDETGSPTDNGLYWLWGISNNVTAAEVANSGVFLRGTYTVNMKES